jgi:hypothetical protein
MLMIFGPGDILLITGNIIFGRDQAQKSLEGGVVLFKRFQQFGGRDHSVRRRRSRREME